MEGRSTALVVDGHVLFRSGLASLYKRNCGFRDVIEASTLDEAAQLLGERPDVCLASFDLALTGIGSPLNLQSLREAFPHLLLIVTGPSRREEILQALACGAHGYMLTTWKPEAIVHAIGRVLAGEIFVPSTLADLPQQPPPGPLAAPEPIKENRLTERQRQVLQLIRSGKSNKEIARLLQLAESTVKVHNNSIYRILGVRNRASAAFAGPSSSTEPQLWRPRTHPTV